MPLVRFLPSGRSFEVSANATLMRAALRARLPVARSCRGVGVCASCRIRVVEGAGNLAPMSEAERQLAMREPLRGNERYACLARVRGDVTVTTTYW